MEKIQKIRYLSYVRIRIRVKPMKRLPHMQWQESKENSYFIRSTSEQVKTVVSEVISLSVILCVVKNICILRGTT